MISSVISPLVTVTASAIATGVVSPSRAPAAVTLSPARVPDVDPIDAAAHLQLLGESLSLIGHRLQETEVRLMCARLTRCCLDKVLAGQ